MARVEIKRKSAEEATAAGEIVSGGITLRFRDDADRDWQRVEGEAGLPDGGAVVVPLARLAETLDLNRFAAVGVRLAPTDDARALAPYLTRLALVEIGFLTFRDGRGYSAARILRDDLKFAGEIRAVGQVLADQLFFMVRCGFDALELDPSVREETALRELERFQFVYQKAADARAPVWAERGA